MSKARIVKILDILRRYSNYDHALNADAISRYLLEVGEEAERKTIYSDISNLREAGYDIELKREGHDVGYYYDGTLFDNAELRILADAVNSSNFITENKSDKMIDKLMSLTNVYDGEIIKDTVSYRHPKTSNEQILYNIDTLQNALHYRKGVNFLYFDLDFNNGKKYRKGMKRYHTVPYAIVWDQERYYLIGFSEKYDGFTHYRIDRMERIEIEETSHLMKPFDVREYVQKTFGMYSGLTREVRLRCRSRLASEVWDQFGEFSIINQKDDDWFTVVVNVRESPVFYSWLFMYGEDVELLGPEDVVEQYRQRCRNVLKRYE